MRKLHTGTDRPGHRATCHTPRQASSLYTGQVTHACMDACNKHNNMVKQSYSGDHLQAELLVQDGELQLDVALKGNHAKESFTRVRYSTVSRHLHVT